MTHNFGASKRLDCPNCKEPLYPTDYRKNGRTWSLTCYRYCLKCDKIFKFILQAEGKGVSP